MIRAMSYILVVVGVILVGCNPYSALTHKLPESSQDSASLALRCLATFPERDTSLKPGQVDTTIHFEMDSVQLKAFKHQLDSLRQRIIDSPNVVFSTDTLIKTFIEHCKPVVKEIRVHSTDTLRIKDAKAEAMLRQSLLINEDLKRKLASTGKFIWMFWLLLTFMILEHIMIIVIFRKKLF